MDHHMPDSQTMKAKMLAYIDAFNTRQADVIARLYAADATLEDPVGSDVKHGREQIAEFYRQVLQAGATLKLAAPVRGSHGNSAAMAFDVAAGGGAMTIRVIDVMTFNEHGEFTNMKAYWAPDDVEMTGGST
jgi:steroid delta-isomerase